jgi:hypothetical protein
MAGKSLLENVLQEVKEVRGRKGRLLEERHKREEQKLEVIL